MPNPSSLRASTLALLAIALSTPAIAETPRTGAPVFTWEGSLELGYDSVYASDDPENEIHDIYPILAVGGDVSFPSGITLFAALVAESVTDPIFDRAFDDVGVYIEELGLSYATGRTTLTFGKLHPSFGTAWDVAAGFYGASLAEEYELAEQIGVMADVELTEGGVLSLALFYADDTALSRSLWYDRGRNAAIEGGAGNTGKLNNATVQWTQELGDTLIQLGARYLSAGEGDVSDETGIVAGIGHEFASGLALFGEVAGFDGYYGSENDARFVTLNAVYGIGNVSLSGTLARRDVETEGVTDLASIAAEYEFENGILIGAALAWVDDAGIRSDAFGFNVIIPFGG